MTKENNTSRPFSDEFDNVERTHPLDSKLLGKLEHEDSLADFTQEGANRIIAFGSKLFVRFLAVVGMLVVVALLFGSSPFNDNLASIAPILEIISEVFIFLVCFGGVLYFVYTPGRRIESSVLARMLEVWRRVIHNKAPNEKASSSDGSGDKTRP